MDQECLCSSGSSFRAHSSRSTCIVLSKILYQSFYLNTIITQDYQIPATLWIYLVRIFNRTDFSSSFSFTAPSASTLLLLVSLWMRWPDTMEIRTLENNVDEFWIVVVVVLFFKHRPHNLKYIMVKYHCTAGDENAFFVLNESKWVCGDINLSGEW